MTARRDAGRRKGSRGTPARRLREADARLALSEARLRAIVECAVDGIVVIDRRGAIEAFDPAAERLFGYRESEVLGRNVKLLMPEPYHGQHDGYLERYLRTGDRRVIGIGREVVGRRSDGSVFPMDLAVSEMRVGRQRKFTGLVRDITERKRQLEALTAAREAAARFRTLVESVQDYGILLLDTKGRVASWNAGAARIKGWREDEILGKDCAMFYPHEARAAGTPERVLAEAARHGRVETEGWRMRKDGSRFWGSAALTALRDESGRLSGYAEVVRDLTERRRSEAELRDREVRLRTLVETTADGIVVFNAQGRIESFNAAAERLFGYRAGEIRNRDVRLLTDMPPDGRPAELGRIMEALRGERAGRRKDGQRFPMDVAVSEMTLADQRLATAIVRDISARKQAEDDMRRLNESLARQFDETRNALQRLQETQAQLIQTEKLASLGGMVAGMAHEINTPLGVAVTATSTVDAWLRKLRQGFDAGSLTRSEAGRLLANSEEGLLAAQRNLRRAADLVRGFKEIAVDQASEQRRHVRLKEYLGEILSSLAPRLRAGGHVVSVEAPEELAADTYPGALAQILTNLVVNTLMHAHPEGHPARIGIAVAQEGDGARIAYRDDGAGIPPQNLAKIFDPFFTTRRGAGGSGLGLHIVHNLVTQVLKGTIRVDSRPGHTEFIVWIPLVAPIREPPLPTVRPAPGASGSGNTPPGSPAA